MADSNLRLVSLAVLGGALDGRRHDPEEVVTEILVGSDPDCHLVVDLPGVSPIHARVWADLDQSVVYDTHAPRGLYVNAARVEGQAPIGEGDVLWLGPPQEPDSVCVQLHFAPWVEVLPATGLAAGAAEPAEPAEPPLRRPPATTTRSSSATRPVAASSRRRSRRRTSRSPRSRRRRRRPTQRRHRIRFLRRSCHRRPSSPRRSPTTGRSPMSRLPCPRPSRPLHPSRR